MASDGVRNQSVGFPLWLVMADLVGLATALTSSRPPKVGGGFALKIRFAGVPNPPRPNTDRPAVFADAWWPRMRPTTKNGGPQQRQPASHVWPFPHACWGDSAVDDAAHRSVEIVVLPRVVCCYRSFPWPVGVEPTSSSMTSTPCSPK